MKCFRRTYGIAAVGILVALTTPGTRGVASQQAPQPPAASGQGTVEEINRAFVQKITQQIAGHEQEPAAKVFKNIQILKTTPADRLLLIMNLGYSKALGVACTHCHAEKDFSSDEKRPKRAAREMALMHRSINEQLSKMENLEPNPQGHFINCSTCHRGAVNPMAKQ